MRICLVSYDYPPASIGGVATYSSHLADGLAAAGHDVTVITDRDQFAEGKANAAEASSDREHNYTKNWVEVDDFPASNELPAVSLYPAHDHEIPFLGIMKGKGRTIRAVLNWSRSVDKTITFLEKTFGRFDVVEMPNGGGAGPEAFFYSLHPRTPLVVRLSTPMSHANSFKSRPSANLGFRLQAYLEVLAVRRAHCLITNSAHNAQTCASLYDLPLSSMQVVHHGIPLTLTPPTRPRSRADKTVSVLFVGRLQRRKGIHCLLQAIPLVTQLMPNVRFEIAGEDTGDAPQHNSYREYLEGFAPTQAIDATTFHGRVDEDKLARLYTESDIVAAPSLSESFGLTYVEAMASAKPVIAFNAGAAPEIVAHNQTGILVETNNIPELADAIVRLAGNAALRREMGERGYQRTRTKFSIRAMVNETIGCYHKAIENFSSTANGNH